jgi:hypothetical protein
VTVSHPIMPHNAPSPRALSRSQVAGSSGSTSSVKTDVQTNTHSDFLLGLVKSKPGDISNTADASAQLDERIRIRSNEAKRFLTLVRDMAKNLLDNVEEGFS